MELVLGIDGGQSVTTAAICDRRGQLLGIGRAGPSNHITEPGGVARAQKAVRTCIAEAMHAAGIHDITFAAAFLGMTGGGELTRQAVQGGVPTQRFRLEHDQVTALASVTMGEPGIVVIAGTGTIAYGEDDTGRRASVSGWGWLLGDEGSGFWIARQAINAATRAWDGRTAPTVLTEKLMAAAGVTEVWDLHRLIYSEQLSRAEIAALAEVVPSAAREGDAPARKILREAGTELALAAVTIARQLQMTERPVTVGMVGGVFQGAPQVRRTFERTITQQLPQATCAAPRFAPVIGSVLLALKMVGVQLTAQIEANLTEASARVGVK